MPAFGMAYDTAAPVRARLSLAVDRVHVYETSGEVPDFPGRFRPVGMYAPEMYHELGQEPPPVCEVHATVVVDAVERRLSRWDVPYWCARVHTILTEVPFTLLVPAGLVDGEIMSGTRSC